MKLVITRFKNIKDGTIGKFELFNQGICIQSGYTLEPEGEDTTTPNRDRRIPQGKYNMAWHKSHRFNRKLPLLYNELVPKTRYILIHAGNYPKDTEGCILVGTSYSHNGVFKSLESLTNLIKNIGSERPEIEIINEFNG